MSSMSEKAISIMLVMVLVLGGWNGMFIGGSKVNAAGGFAGGTGLLDDPYQIATAAELDEVRKHLGPDIYFKLTADIDLSGYAEGEGWMPIGDSFSRFQGNMNGNGFKISKLTINRPDLAEVGLFGNTENGSLITNIKLEGIVVHGRVSVGGLVGNGSGTISDSYATGNVIAASSYAGGLVGFNIGPISNSYATVNVSVTGKDAGGLIGANMGRISNSYATGNVSAISNAGGLIGSNNGEINDSYATGSVVATGDTTGGLVGNNNNTINNSFYDKDTTGQTDIGSGEGKTTAEMKTSSTFTDWDFDEDWYITTNNYPQLWAFTALTTGTNSGTTKLINVVSDMEYSLNNGEYTQVTSTTIDNISVKLGDTISVRIVADPSSVTTLKVDSNNFKMLTPPVLKVGWTSNSSIFGIDITFKDVSLWRESITEVSDGEILLVRGTDYTVEAGKITVYSDTLTPGVHKITVKANNYTTALVNHTIVPSYKGTGLLDDPYQIATAAQLYEVRYHLESNIYFKLTADIDLSGYTTDEGWMPIGEWPSNFQENMNGNGFKIRNLTINRPDSQFVGLFGTSDASSSITNIMLEGILVQGAASVGGLVGENYGSISDSYVIGSVSATGDTAGGLVGYSSGSIINSYAKGNVSLVGNNAGGLVGFNGYTISNSYATGDVSATGNTAGGLVGVSYGTINSSYAVGRVTGTTSVGGLVGEVPAEVAEPIIIGFYDTATTGQSDPGKGEGKTTVEMKTLSTYDNWENFSNIWAIDPLRNNGYPHLIAFNVNITYDGNGNNGGSVPQNSKTYSKGEKVIILANTGHLVKSGYTFAGWNTLADGSGSNYLPGEEFLITAGTTLYAKWMLNDSSNNGGGGLTPLPTATPVPTPVPTRTPAPKAFFNDKVNIGDIKALVEKANTAPAVTFNDVPENSAIAKSIQLGAKLGIIKGNTAGSFHANDSITRAEFATMLVRALGLSAKGDSNFKDTKGHWAEDAIGTLQTIGIINGYSDGTFKPNQTITRAEIVTMLSKFINITLVKKGKFNDVSGHWAEAEIDTLSELGIVKGTGAGLFKPNANATRFESLVMILRMLNASLSNTLDIE